ncbi:DUF1499 domain-containing protein [Maricaulaceae bacterium MS644]
MESIFRTIRHLIVGAAATAAIGVPLWFVITAFGGKYGLWTPLEAFRHVLITAGLPGFGGGFLLPLTAGLGAVALIVAVAFRLVFGAKNAPGPGGYVAGVAALVVGLAPMGMIAAAADSRGDIPPIHDISTDTANPPQFTQSLIDRREQDGARNSVDYASKTNPADGRPLPEVQAEAYPEVQPVMLPVTPDLAYQAALEVAREMGWTVSTASEDAMMFEATATSFWFGFKDDIVVRITPAEDESGARVDARSVSRVGTSDLGANAARLEAFAQNLSSSVTG